MTGPEVIQRPARRGWFRRVLGWPVSAVLIIGTVLLGSLILRYVPGSQEMSRPFIHSGPMKSELDGHTFVMTAKSVRGGQAVDEDGDEYTTDGVFVVVTVTVTARQEPTQLKFTAVRDRDGRVFLASERFTQGLYLRQLQPGLPIQADILFEVPRDAADGLVLQLSSDFWGRQNLNQTVAEVDLDIDQPTVTKWLAQGEPVEYRMPEVIL